MSKIKICGLTRKQDIEVVNQYLPDYIGFVFAKSKRQLTLNEAKGLKAFLDPRIMAVGVFVNEPIENLIEFEKEKVIDMIQLHGDEDKAYINQVKSQVKIPIIKAIRVKDAIDLEQVNESEYILFDKYTKDAYGGSGERFDWDILKDIKKPYFLAGGIHLGNLERALSIAPYAIDLSSGVESEGIKDPRKIHQVMEIIKNNR